jgi:hypothetical protein
VSAHADEVQVVKLEMALILRDGVHARSSTLTAGDAVEGHAPLIHGVQADGRAVTARG